MITELNTLGFAVEESVFNDFVSGKEDTFSAVLDADTQNELLENIKGNLLLNVEQLPDTFHGCWWYNGGHFPYIVKRSLEYIVLVCGDKRIVGRIASCEQTHGRRFRLGTGPENPSRWDENGDDCIWTIHFKLLFAAGE